MRELFQTLQTATGCNEAVRRIAGHTLYGAAPAAAARR
jgi:hypothetical protein